MPIVIAFASGVPVGAASRRKGYGAQWNKAKQSQGLELQLLEKLCKIPLEVSFALYETLRERNDNFWIIYFVEHSRIS
ncbi:MAG: hypothetical protein V7K39_26025 [Nostoc sp.]